VQDGHSMCLDGGSDVADGVVVVVDEVDAWWMRGGCCGWVPVGGRLWIRSRSSRSIWPIHKE
jgi:hypothetical protein